MIWRIRAITLAAVAWLALVPTPGLAGAEPRDVLQLVSIAGRVVDARGGPVADVRVFQSGDGPERTEAVSDSDGRFRLGGLPACGAFVFAEKTGFRFHGQWLDAGEAVGRSDASLQFVLHPADQPAPSRLRSLPSAVSSLGGTEARTWALGVYRERLDRILAGDAEGEFTFVSWELPKVRPDWIVEHLDQLEQVFGKEIEPRERMLRAVAGQIAPDDFDEALALVRHVRRPFKKIQAHLFFVAAEENRLPEKQSLRAASEAALIASQLPDVTDRIMYQRWIAMQLADSQPDVAAALLTEAEGYLTDASLTPAYLKIYRGLVATGWAFLDPDRAWELMQSSRDSDYLQIASALSRRQPAESERFFNAYPLADSETNTLHARQRLPDICSWIARTEPDRARRMADRVLDFGRREDLVEQLARTAADGEAGDSPELRSQLDALLRKAAVYAAIADVASPADPNAARRLAREAFQTVRPVRRGLDKYGYSEHFVAPANVVSLLLPVVERIDPDWGQELLWRTLAARLPVPSEDGELRQRHDASLAALCVMLSRYDRAAALQVLRPVLERERSRSFNGNPPERWVTDCYVRINPDAAAEWVETLCDTPYENSRRSPRFDMRQIVAEFYLGEDTRPESPPERRRRADLRLVREMVDIYVDDESARSEG